MTKLVIVESPARAKTIGSVLGLCDISKVQRHAPPYEEGSMPKPAKTKLTGNTLEDFRAYLIEKDRAPLTVKCYLRDLTLFAHWFERSTDQPLTPEVLTPIAAREYKQRLLSTDKASPATINRRLAALRAYVAWALAKGFIEYDPLGTIQSVPEQPITPKGLSKQEQSRVLREVEKTRQAARTETAQRQAIRDQAIIVVLLNTGLRVGELIALKLGDVKLSERQGEVRVRSGKGTQARTVPLNRPAREALHHWLEAREDADADTDRLFIGKRGALTQNAVQRQLVGIGRRAKVDLTPHVLRRAFAKNLVNAKVSMEKVAALLGHGSLNAMQRYTLPSQADLAEATEVLEN